MAEDAEGPGDYLGTAALNVDVPDRPREIVLAALDVWQKACVLRGAAALDRENPFWLPGSWRMTTDLGTSHAPRGGGGAWLRWLVNLEPSLPQDAQELRFFVGPDDERLHKDASLPEEPSVIVALSNRRSRSGRRGPASTAPESRVHRSTIGRILRPTRYDPTGSSL